MHEIGDNPEMQLLLRAQLERVLQAWPSIRHGLHTNSGEAFNRVLHKYIPKDRIYPVSHPALARLAVLDDIFGRGVWRRHLLESTGIDDDDCEEE